jgi:hypothetical protein
MNVSAAEMRRWAAAGLIDPVDLPTAKRRAAPDVRTPSRGKWSITLTLACRVVSEANRPSGEHWSVKRRRKKVQAIALTYALIESGLKNHRPPLPLIVTWTHIGPHMDDGDNLNVSFKALRDRLAAWLGVDDGDERVEWRYAQRSGEPGVEVCIEGGGK